MFSAFTYTLCNKSFISPALNVYLTNASSSLWSVMAATLSFHLNPQIKSQWHKKNQHCGTCYLSFPVNGGIDENCFPVDLSLHLDPTQICWYLMKHDMILLAMRKIQWRNSVCSESFFLWVYQNFIFPHCQTRLKMSCAQITGKGRDRYKETIWSHLLHFLKKTDKT